MIKFLLTVLLLYLAIRTVRTIVFGNPAPSRSHRPFAQNRPRSERLDQVEEAEYIEIKP